MNAKPATSHVALTGVYEQDYRRWTPVHTRTAIRTIFWGAITLAGVALTVYGLVTWA